MAKDWKLRAGIIAVCLLISSCVSGCGGGSKQNTPTSSVPKVEQQQQKPAETKPQTEPPKQEMPPAPTPPPKAEPTLHVNPHEFRARYNEFLHSSGGMIGESGALDLGEPAIKTGSVNDAVAYANNNLNLALNETIDKNTGEIKEVFLTAAIAGKDSKTIQSSLISAIVSYNALIYAVDPDADIDAIQADLGLHESIDKWVKDTNTVHGDVKYFKMVIKGIGMSFGASAQ